MKNKRSVASKTHYIDFRKDANLLCNSKSLDGHWILEPDSFFREMRVKDEYENLCKNCIRKVFAMLIIR